MTIFFIKSANNLNYVKFETITDFMKLLEVMVRAMEKYDSS